MKPPRMELKQLQADYGGRFVALLDDEPVASGSTFREALEAARARGVLEREELSFRYIYPRRGVCVY